MVIRGLIIIAWVLAGCVIDSLDLTGKPCPCPDDWACDPVTATCARQLSTDRDGAPADPDADPYACTDATGPLSEGLTAYFRFDETSGQTVCDSSPASQHGWAFSAQETMWTPGMVDGGMRFNGEIYESFVLFPSMSEPCLGFTAITGSFTASAWVRFDSFHPAPFSLGDVVAMHGSAGGLEGGWGIGASDRCGPTTASVSITPPGSAQRVNRCGTTALQVDTWYHLAGVYDASSLSLDIYLNGTNDSGDLAEGSPAIPSSIGAPPAIQCPYLAASANQANLLHGTLDEFRLYDRALTAAEIAELPGISE